MDCGLNAKSVMNAALHLISVRFRHTTAHTHKTAVCALTTIKFYAGSGWGGLPCALLVLLFRCSAQVPLTSVRLASLPLHLPPAAFVLSSYRCTLLGQPSLGGSSRGLQVLSEL
jgi:hypothetical protein